MASERTLVNFKSMGDLAQRVAKRINALNTDLEEAKASLGAQIAETAETAASELNAAKTELSNSLSQLAQKSAEDDAAVRADLTSGLATAATNLNEAKVELQNGIDTVQGNVDGLQRLVDTNEQNTVNRLQELKNSAATYKLERTEASADDVLATYQLVETLGDNTRNITGTFDIKKDFLLKHVELWTAEASNSGTGVVAGHTYLVLTFNTKDTESGSVGDTRQYLDVARLIDIYTAGNGVSIVDNKVAIKFDAVNKNGLVATEDGLGINIVSANGAGAMSADQYNRFVAVETKLATVAEGGVKISASEVNGNVKVTSTNGVEDLNVYTLPEDVLHTTDIAQYAGTGGVDEMLTDLFGSRAVLGLPLTI